MTGQHPYDQAAVALLTRHEKESVIAPALHQTPGMQVRSVSSIDTDLFGTFSGEIERPDPPAETAIRKARCAIEVSGEPRGLASEGTFGPHPKGLIVPAGLEILAFIDDEIGIELTVKDLTVDTNFAHLRTAGLDERTERFLVKAGFGPHAMIVRPNVDGSSPVLVKGVTDRLRLRDAATRCARVSPDGLARIETDMRANHNPTRMLHISRVARMLATRLTCRCPDCETPGYGIVDATRGLPCRVCATPTEWIAAEIEGCPRCPRRRTRPRTDGLTKADPRHCPTCNP